jgi:hypothetical protein
VFNSKEYVIKLSNPSGRTIEILSNYQLNFWKSEAALRDVWSIAALLRGEIEEAGGELYKLPDVNWEVVVDEKLSNDSFHILVRISDIGILDFVVFDKRGVTREVFRLNKVPEELASEYEKETVVRRFQVNQLLQQIIGMSLGIDSSDWKDITRNQLNGNSNP